MIRAGDRVKIVSDIGFKKKKDKGIDRAGTVKKVRGCGTGFQQIVVEFDGEVEDISEWLGANLFKKIPDFGI